MDKINKVFGITWRFLILIPLLALPFVYGGIGIIIWLLNTNGKAFSYENHFLALLILNPLSFLLCIFLATLWAERKNKSTDSRQTAFGVTWRYALIVPMICLLENSILLRFHYDSMSDLLNASTTATVRIAFIISAPIAAIITYLEEKIKK